MLEKACTPGIFGGCGLACMTSTVDAERRIGAATLVAALMDGMMLHRELDDELPRRLLEKVMGADLADFCVSRLPAGAGNWNVSGRECSATKK